VHSRRLRRDRRPAESSIRWRRKISRAEAELRAHQAELERHVAERTASFTISPITTHLRSFQPRQLSARGWRIVARHSATGQRLGLLFVDVDNFKSINDTLGHNFGDACCRESQSGFVPATTGRALLARLGGDEFTILVEDVKSV